MRWENREFPHWNAVRCGWKVHCGHRVCDLWSSSSFLVLSHQTVFQRETARSKPPEFKVSPVSFSCNISKTPEAPMRSTPPWVWGKKKVLTKHFVSEHLPPKTRKEVCWRDPTLKFSLSCRKIKLREIIWGHKRMNTANKKTVQSPQLNRFCHEADRKMEILMKPPSNRHIRVLSVQWMNRVMWQEAELRSLCPELNWTLLIQHFETRVCVSWSDSSGLLDTIKHVWRVSNLDIKIQTFSEEPQKQWHHQTADSVSKQQYTS